MSCNNDSDNLIKNSVSLGGTLNLLIGLLHDAGNTPPPAFG
ncbi:hypothetical protein SXCC_00737 [Gluconacetobacter sp. SXCC-1]|nr:hypothetical protein SXCC_00737 [Gluconacetobacter sp. SXCC-1]